MFTLVLSPDYDGDLLDLTPRLVRGQHIRVPSEETVLRAVLTDEEFDVWQYETTREAGQWSSEFDGDPRLLWYGSTGVLFLDVDDFTYHASLWKEVGDGSGIGRITAEEASEVYGLPLHDT